jgi:hypothetical protein
MPGFGVCFHFPYYLIIQGKSDSHIAMFPWRTDYVSYRSAKSRFLIHLLVRLAILFALVLADSGVM